MEREARGAARAPPPARHAVRDGQALFSGGLRNQFALADLKMNRLLGTFDEWARSHGRDADAGPPERFEPTRAPESSPLKLDLRNGHIRSIVWATGFQPDYRWLDLPVIDENGHVRHDGGVVEAPGLYALGLPFLRRRKSTFISGAEDDARDAPRDPRRIDSAGTRVEKLGETRRADAFAATDRRADRVVALDHDDRQPTVCACGLTSGDDWHDVAAPDSGRAQPVCDPPGSGVDLRPRCEPVAAGHTRAVRRVGQALRKHVEEPALAMEDAR